MKRIAIIDTLRGVASLLVLWNHLTGGLLEYPTVPWLRAAGDKAWIGVPIFFVISGFVIPYALEAAGFALRDWGRFVLKRAIRIDIPCYVSVAIICLLGLTIGAIRFETAPRFITLPQVLLHLGYLNYIFGYEFLNGVLWSLAVEFQYYLLIALVFPLLLDKRAWLFPYLLLGVLAFVAPDRQLVFHYGYLFLLGIATFHHVRGTLPRSVYLGVLSVLATGAFFTTDGWSTGAAAATALLIAFGRDLRAPLQFFGKISYSLYLIHVPIALRIIRAFGRPQDGLLRQCAVLAAGGVASVAAAWVLWRWVEAPSQRWASLLRYGQAARASAEVEAAPAR
jgi:peptidoglycan/LPS O-acetylase OafA/YrhL